MTRRSFTIAMMFAGLAITLAAVPTLQAQLGTPPRITAPIHAARRVAAATNAHLDAEQHPGAQAPAARRPAGQERAVASAATPAANGSRSARSANARTSASARRGAVRSPAARERADSAGPVLTRESFTYASNGRRDPFVSLMTSGVLRPTISDLRLVAVIYDPTGHSVAVLRDLSTKDQYRVKVGRTLGRMRVAQIRPKAVTFTLEEFGYSRQETLALNDSTTVRAQ